jgi:hypothetical protein
MVSLLLGVLEQLLKVGGLAMEERHKYEDNMLQLKKDWYAEFQKPADEISHMRLDELQLQLRLLGEAILEAARTKKA